MSERLLRKAYSIFKAIRTLPLDVAADLMGEGYDVEHLEERWRAIQDKNHVVCYGWTDEAEALYADAPSSPIGFDRT